MKFKARTVRRGVVVIALAVALAAHWGEAIAEVVPDPAVRTDFPPAEYPDGYCEDELGNQYELPLQRYQAGMRPVGPCLPIGSWEAIRGAQRGDGSEPRR